MRPSWIATGSIVLALGSTAMAGCEPTTCTLEARASVTLQVVDAQTGDDVDATVTFELDGDGPREPEEGWPGTYVLGTEQAGTFAVTVSADGYETATAEYVVTEDECHVETVDDTIELMPTP
ncbi:MAG: hypothetical protein AAGF11_12955 [Myxococcota bacterium]